ncbi:MAG: hypothetical protein R3C14_08365 [Caldilineaceae bacterium]
MLFFWNDTAYDVDDAPITYRYAENLATGVGFVYNPGERILGTSTPLYAMLLALLRLVGLPIPLASNSLNFISSLLITYLVMALTNYLTHSWWAGILSALYLLVQGPFLRFTMSGMETPFYTLLILLAIYALLMGKSHWAAAWAALAFLTRLDGLVIVGAVLLALWVQRRKLPWPEIGVAALIILPWIGFATLYFGSPLPLSMLAKQHHLQERGSSRFWIWQHLFLDGMGAPTFLLSFALLGVWDLMRRHAQKLLLWLPALLWFFAYLCAYTLVGIDFYEWYQTPLYPVLAIWVGVGLYALLTKLLHTEGKAALVALQCLCSAVILALWFAPYITAANLSTQQFRDYLTTVEKSRALAGEWLRTFAPPDSRIYTGFIGYIGYESQRYIIDGAGLVTPPTQLSQQEPTIYVLEGYAPARQECGPVKDFKAVMIPNTLISMCNLAPMGSFGPLLLADARITNFVHTQEDGWHRKSDPYLETQWLIAAALAPQTWTVYVHFVDAEGNTLFQADHELGLQVDRTVIPLADWEPEQRHYVYAEMPEKWAELAGQVTAIRLGLWNPATGDALPIEPQRVVADPLGGLKLQLQDGDIVQ